MSSKVTLKWQDQTETTPGFQVYEDVLDTFGDDSKLAPIYLTLDGVDVELETTRKGKARVTVELPRETAIQLGLIKE